MMRLDAWGASRSLTFLMAYLRPSSTAGAIGNGDHPQDTISAGKRVQCEWLASTKPTRAGRPQQTEPPLNPQAAAHRRTLPQRYQIVFLL